MIRSALALSTLALLTVGWACRTRGPVRTEGPWLKGNTHTHTLWSDGNAAPELVASFYAGRDYDFLVLTDHNVLSTGERWFPIAEGKRLTPAHVEALIETFGAERVELRETETGHEMRLRTLDELREQFEAPGDLLFLQGEEITSEWEGHPVHVNGVNVVDRIPAQSGGSVVEVMNAAVDAVAAQAAAQGRPMLAHVNHPNFQWGLTWQDLAQVANDRFFEVYNGHSGVRNQGDAEHPSTERMWDLANAHRLTELGLDLLWAVATDDSHDYHTWGVGRTNPGRGWVMVEAASRTPDAIVEAMRAGHFYASSGVTLRSIESDSKTYRVDVAAEPGLEYVTTFLGARVKDGRATSVGETLLETSSLPAVYEFAGDELFLRAVVTSSRPHPNPYAAGDLETAWTQPVRPER